MPIQLTKFDLYNIKQSLSLSIRMYENERYLADCMEEYGQVKRITIRMDTLNDILLKIQSMIYELEGD